MRILTVDDDPILLKLLKKNLTALGYNQVTQATSGQLALDAISSASEQFDCFILDIRMPKMDGSQLCEKIRSKRKYKKAPVIMLTALKSDEDIRTAFAAGATDYVTKPLDSFEIATRLKVAEYVVGKQRSIDESAFISKMLGGSDIDANLFFEAPVSMGNSSGCLSVSALENYIQQLARGENGQVCVVGFKFSHAYRAFSLLSGENYYQTLRSIAQVVAKISKEFGLLISYSGSGYFVGVGNSLSREDSEEIGRLVNCAIVESGWSDLHSRDISASVRAGLPCRHCDVSQMSAKELMLSAIESVRDVYECRGSSTRTGLGVRDLPDISV